MSNKKQIRQLLYIEDGIVDKNQVSCWVDIISDEYPKFEIKVESISLMGRTCGKRLEEIKNAIQSAHIIVFDYGGLCQVAFLGAGHAAIDYWNRFFINAIKETPGKDWRCISALDTYEPEEREELEVIGVKFQW